VQLKTCSKYKLYKDILLFCSMFSLISHNCAFIPLYMHSSGYSLQLQFQPGLAEQQMSALHAPSATLSKVREVSQASRVVMQHA
jgi:hypothetical protein